MALIILINKYVRIFTAGIKRKQVLLRWNSPKALLLPHPDPCGGLIGRKPKIKIPLARALFSSSCFRWDKSYGFIPTEA